MNSSLNLQVCLCESPAVREYVAFGSVGLNRLELDSEGDNPKLHLSCDLYYLSVRVGRIILGITVQQKANKSLISNS